LSEFRLNKDITNTESNNDTPNFSNESGNCIYTNAKEYTNTILKKYNYYLENNIGRNKDKENVKQLQKFYENLIDIIININYNNDTKLANISTKIQKELKFLESLGIAYISNKSHLKDSPNLAFVQFTLPIILLDEFIPKIMLFTFLLTNYHLK
jgi:hypothetical protein